MLPSTLKTYIGRYGSGHRTFRRFVYTVIAGLCVIGLNFGLNYRPAHAATVIIVNTIVDAGGLCTPFPTSCTLRQALAAALTGDTITFNIAGAGVHTISLTSPLPGISKGITIDGTTQPGGAACGPAFNLLIVVKAGVGFGAAGDGLLFSAGSDGSVVKGLVVNNFPQNGISLDNGGSNSVTCSFIGTDATGTIAQPNGTSGGGRGIQIGNSLGALNQNNVIGGTTAAARNIISANIFEGVAIIGNAVGVNNNTIEGNYIGTDVTGTVALANGLAGVGLFGSILGNVVSGNVVGGATPGARNIISGNTSFAGVSIDCVACSNNLVEGNYIGTRASGLSLLGNAFGIAIFGGSQNNTVRANVVSGNVTSGISVNGAGTNGNIIDGNFIGTNPSGTAAVPNGTYGLDIFGGAQNTTVSANVISGNTTSGAGANDPGTNGNIFTGNFIGTNATGTAVLANGSYGIDIFNGAQNNRIGGTTPAERNIISGNAAQGVVIQDPFTSNNVVEGNYIGCNVTGTTAFGNNVGINIFGAATNNTVGGVVPGAANLISGNLLNGVVISQASTTNNIVIGNYIGVNASGTAALANTGSDIAITLGAANNRIGGTTPAERNIISGSLISGVRIHDPFSTGNIVEGNYIGTNPAGTAAIANANYGVDVYNGATGNTIGGTTPGTANLISGNTQDGIHISDPGTSGNNFFGNLIGTTAGGGSALPNGGNGVLVLLTASGNAIGGTAAGQANVIDYNTGAGVSTIAGLNGNPVRGNSIYQNGGLGISALGSVPVLTSAGVIGNSYQLSGTLTATPLTTYTIDFYSNVVGDPSLSGEGQTYLGSVSITTNGAGFANFGPATYPIVAGHAVLSATATDSSGNTSQFSVNAVVVLPVAVAWTPSDGCVIVTLTTPQETVLSDEQITLTPTVINNCGRTITNVVVIVQVGTPLIILSPLPDCRQVTLNVGTLNTGQQYISSVLVSTGVFHIAPAASTAQASVQTNFSVNQFASFRPGLEQLARAAESALASRGQTAVNIVQATWDDQNIATASEIVTVLPNGALPGTGEHPAAPISSPVIGLADLLGVGVFGLIALLLLDRKLRMRTNTHGDF